MGIEEPHSGSEYAPRSLVEHLRWRIDRHGQQVRELSQYIDSLAPEVMHERQKTMRHEIQELKEGKADKSVIDGLIKEVQGLHSAFNRMLVAIVLACISIVLTILASSGKL